MSQKEESRSNRSRSHVNNGSESGGESGGGSQVLPMSRERSKSLHLKLPETSRSPSPLRKQPFNMATPGTRLAQEIHEEFLVCKICSEGYKSPKSLSCLHTFCEQCIENQMQTEGAYKKYSDYRDFTCPVCRKRTQLPSGGVRNLPDNFLVAGLSEIVVRQRPSKYPFCDICKQVSKKHREATMKCLDCVKLLCASCVGLHRETKVTAGHSLFDVEIEKDIECREHADEVIRFYCEPCETCVCVLCTFNEHKDHEISQFSEAVEKYKTNIQQMFHKCKARIEQFDAHIESLNVCEDIIAGVTQRIHDTAIHFIQEIRAKEKQLVEEIQNIYGKEVMEAIEKKKDLTLEVESMKSTCNLTEVVLAGKDIELLLLKKDVEEKLTQVNGVEMRAPPTTVNKMINFIPGDMDLGYVVDMDRPTLTNMRVKKVSFDNISGNAAASSSNSNSLSGLKNSLPSGEKMIRPGIIKTVSENEEGRTKTSLKTQQQRSLDQPPPSMVKHKPPAANATPLAQTKGKPAVDIHSSQSDSSDDEHPKKGHIETADNSTQTATVPTVEVGINTRSRSLQSLPTQKDVPNNPGTAAAPAKKERVPHEDDDLDPSVIDRRRRIRDRCPTVYRASYSVDQADGLPPEAVAVRGDSYTMSAYLDRKNRRAAAVEGASAVLFK